MGKRQPPRRRLPFGKGTGGMTWEYEGNAGWLPKDPYRPPSALPKGQPGVDYKVTADDVITAVLIGGGLAVADEVALIAEATEIAYRFNQYAKKSESEIGTVKDIYDWIKDNVFPAGAGVPGNSSVVDGRGGKYEPQGSNIYPGKFPPGYKPGGYVPVDPRVYPNSNLYPGKVPPGWGPGRPQGWMPGHGSSGPSGTSARAGRNIRGSIRYEKN